MSLLLLIIHGVFMNSLGSRVKGLRKRKELTQTELGSMVGLHHTNIGRIENKDAIPQADILYLIAKNLDTSVEWLLTGNTTFSPASNTFELKSTLDLPIQNEQLLNQLVNVWQQLTEQEQIELLKFAKYTLFQRTVEL
jgi:transcriptional regulator with XRE-family HTH domain